MKPEIKELCEKIMRERFADANMGERLIIETTIETLVPLLAKQIETRLKSVFKNKDDSGVLSLDNAGSLNDVMKEVSNLL